jgi:hypothetical protein
MIPLTPVSLPGNPAPPPLRPWQGGSSAMCSLEEIPAFWEAYDVITFLADLGMYHQSLYDLLDTAEKEREQKFRSEYFKKRFTISHCLLKLILQTVLGAAEPSDILLGRERKGRVMVPSRPDIGISLSYSGPCIAITVGKQKVGSDLELMRTVRSGKITSSQIFLMYYHPGDGDSLRQVIHMWTMAESYAKLYDENPYSLLRDGTVFRDVSFVSYCIDNHMIFSIASKKKHFTDLLVRLDIGR